MVGTVKRMGSDWRAHARPAITAAVRPHRAEGWRAGPSAARFQGEDGHWAHVFLVHIPFRQHLRLGFCAGTYSPLLREAYGFRTNRSRPPHQDYWASSLVLSFNVPIHVMNTAANHVPAPFEITPQGAHPQVRLDWTDFSAWFGDAFETVRPELLQLTSDRALFDHLRRKHDDLFALRDACMLGAVLGHDDELPEMIDRAAGLSDRWAADMRESDQEWRFHDRSRSPILWSHKRFVRQLDQVRADRPGPERDSVADSSAPA